jgi:phospholipid/cholesterol/gamma-HCH transport system substrate-binding protein
METRANYVLIGLFTLATIIGAFGFVYWFHHVGGVAVRNYYRVVFQGPIGGLRTGAQVNFNGIRAGEVVELSLDANDPKQALVTISVAAGTPLRADTKVSLEFQGLTGIATLALKGGDPAAAPVPRKDGELPTLIAAPTASQDVMQAARDTLSRIDGLVAENQAAIKASIKSIETFTETLAKNSPRIDRIIAGVDTMIGGPEGKGDVPEAVRAIKNTAENLDKKIDGLVVDGRRTLNVIERAVRNIDENPTRLIFGGGKPGNAPPAASSQRQASPQSQAPASSSQRRQASPQPQ